MVPRDEHDLGVRQRLRQPRELHERVQDRLIGRADRVEHVAGNEHDVRRQLDHTIDRRAKRRRHVRLPLIDPAGSQPLILPVAEMKIREVDEAQVRQG